MIFNCLHFLGQSVPESAFLSHHFYKFSILASQSEDKRVKTAFNYQNLSDKEVVQHLLVATNANDKRKLQEELYDRYAHKIFKKCYGILHNQSQAEDLTHDILIKIFVNLHQYKGHSFNSWVMAIAQNHTIDYLKKENRLKFEPISRDYNTVPSEPELNNEALLETQLQEMENAFSLLSESHRLILMMRYKDRQSIKEISKALKVGESAIKMRLKRGRTHLANLINKKHET